MRRLKAAGEPSRTNNILLSESTSLEEERATSEAATSLEEEEITTEAKAGVGIKAITEAVAAEAAIRKEQWGNSRRIPMNHSSSS